MQDPTTPVIEIAKHAQRIRRNRHFVEGEFQVRQQRTAYLPALPQHYSEGYIDWVRYLEFIMRVEFFPAASRTLDGFIGLIFRKPPILKASASIEALAHAITDDLASLDDLAGELVRETFTTNFSGLWIDRPPQAAGVSEAQATANGGNPYITLFPYESILEVRRQMVNNRAVLGYVRLLVDASTVRELMLVDGIYQTVDTILTGSSWQRQSPIIPTKAGKPLNSLPFVLVTTKPGAICPQHAVIDDVVSLNQTHYLECADLANSMYWASTPIVYASGVEKDTQLSLVAGSFHVFDKPDAKIQIVQFDGSYIPTLQAKIKETEEHLASVGARLLASEKAAAEAAQTLAIRQAGESSILAGNANMIARKITEALGWVSFWIDAGEATYTLNTDYNPNKLDGKDLAAYVAAVQAGALSHETFFETLQDYEAVRPDLSYEVEKQRLENDAADRPPTAPLPNPLTANLDQPVNIDANGK